jgi:hypothetical protein
MLAKIVRARQLAGRRADLRLAEERTHGGPKAAAAIAAMAMPQKRAVAREWESVPATQDQESIDFSCGVSGHRDQSGLVKLGFPDEQRALPRVVIPDDQARELTPSHASRVQEHDREPHHLGTQRGIVRWASRPSRREQLPDLALGEDVRPDGLMDGRKESLVRDKAARLAASPVQTCIADLAHPGPPIA